MTLDIAQRLRVKRQVKTLWEVLKEGGFINFYCFSLFNGKTWTIKAFLEVKVSTIFQKFMKKSRQFCCTSLLCSSKLIDFRQQNFSLSYLKFGAGFNELSLDC